MVYVIIIAIIAFLVWRFVKSTGHSGARRRIAQEVVRTLDLPKAQEELEKAESAFVGTAGNASAYSNEELHYMLELAVLLHDRVEQWSGRPCGVGPRREYRMALVKRVNRIRSAL
jgi:hypothetical protein